ncbi:UNVERIFIED_CONTAM: hypothetical protein NCL1_23325 [Trichonephila clavipes]
MAYYYGTTHQNVINCSSMDWKTLRNFFGSSPIDRMCTHYSEVADDKSFTLTLFVKIWKPQQKVLCTLWLTEFKSVTREQRGVRIEWNVVNGFLIDLSGLLQNQTRTRSTVSAISQKLKDACQFEIPMFESPLKFFPIGG